MTRSRSLAALALLALGCDGFYAKQLSLRDAVTPRPPQFFGIVRAYAERELHGECRDVPDGLYSERLPRRRYAFEVNRRPVLCWTSMWGVAPEVWTLDDQVAELRRELEAEFGPESVAVDDDLGKASECRRPWPAQIYSP